MLCTSVRLSQSFLKLLVTNSLTIPRTSQGSNRSNGTLHVIPRPLYSSVHNNSTWSRRVVIATMLSERSPNTTDRTVEAPQQSLLLYHLHQYHQSYKTDVFLPESSRSAHITIIHSRLVRTTVVRLKWRHSPSTISRQRSCGMAGQTRSEENPLSHGYQDSPRSTEKVAIQDAFWAYIA